MKSRTGLLTGILLFAAWLFAQTGVYEQGQRPVEERHDQRLPNGRKQSDELLKVEHAKNIEDAASLVKLSEDLKMELEKNDRWVLSLDAIKKTEEIEKLAKRVRNRLKRY